METEKPPFRRARATSSASSWLSSTCSTRSWPGCAARSLVGSMSRSCKILGVFHYYRRLIDDQPVQSHALDRFPELFEVDWFLNIAVSSQVVTGRQIPLLFRRGHDDDRDRLGPGVALDLFEHFHPIDLWQFQIQQHQFWGTLKRPMSERPATEDEVQGFLAVARDEDVVCQFLPPQRVQGKIHIVLIVFPKKDV